MTKRIHIGAAGIYHEHWKPILGVVDILPLLAKNFTTAEVQYTFYHYPSQELMKHWVSQVPESFIFSVKAPKLITHFKKLSDVAEDLNAFLASLEPLENHLGPIVFELPKNIEKNLSLLQGFLQLCPGSYRTVMEFRHKSWFDDEVMSCLQTHNTALSIVHAPRYKPVPVATADFAYFKFYGTSRWFNYDYSDDEIACWKDTCKGFADDGKEVFVYFCNDEESKSYRNALAMKGR